MIFPVVLPPPITTVFGWQQLFRMLVSFVIIIIIIISIYSASTAEPHCRYTLSCGCLPSHIHPARIYVCTMEQFNFSPLSFLPFFFLGAPIHTQITAGSFEKQENFIFKNFYFHDFRDQVIWVIFNYV